jgi:hypothetical protein
MASARLYWSAAPCTVADYRINRLPTVQGPVDLLAVVPAEEGGPAWDAAQGRFTWVDAEGDPEAFYRVDGYDAGGIQVAQSPLFQPSAASWMELEDRVRVDADYGGTDNLRFTEPGGAPIDQAEIRVFREVDYIQGLTATAVATSRTRVDGRWETPVFLPHGLTYVVWFYKAGSHGPSTATITV